jgi:hypothetical protein
MSEKKEPNEESEHLSVADMQDWLRQEIMDATKAAELRLKQASELVIAYAKGELSPAETSERLFDYDQRWGSALRGATAAAHLTDEQILKRIDWMQKNFGPRQGWKSLKSFRFGEQGPSENER